MKWLFEKAVLGLIVLWIIAAMATYIWDVLRPVLPFIIFALFIGVTIGSIAYYFHRKRTMRYW